MSDQDAQSLLSVEEQNAKRIKLRLTGRVERRNVVATMDQFKGILAGASADTVAVDLDGMMGHDHNGIALVRALARASAEAGRTIEWQNTGEGLDELLRKLAQADAADSSVDRNVPLPLQVGESTAGFLADCRAILAFVGELAHSLWLAARHPQFVRWQDTLLYMARTGSDAVPIVALLCFLMGLILAFQGAMQMHQFGADIFVADLVGLSIVMELGPLMVAMICTGRAGSAFAAEIGTMKVSEEVDALVTMGLDPTRFLVLPKVLALTFVMPMLTLFGDLFGIAGGFVVGMVQLDLPFTAYYQETTKYITVWHISQGVIKSVVFALLISAVGCLRGLRTDGGAQGVGTSTTSAVVSGIFLVVVADSVLTIIFQILP